MPFDISAAQCRVTLKTISGHLKFGVTHSTIDNRHRDTSVVCERVETCVLRYFVYINNVEGENDITSTNTTC